MDADTKPYVARLRERDPDEVRIQAKHVADLVEHPGWRALTDLLDQAHRDAVQRLTISGSTGRVLEQAEYARLVGFLAGLEQAGVAARAFQVADTKRRQSDPEGE